MFTLSNIRRPEVTRALPWTALALFTASLLSPAMSGGQFFTDDSFCKDPPWSWGWELVLLGPLALPEQFGWIANPLMLLAAITTGRGALTKAANLGSALAAVVLIVATPFTFTSFWMDGGGLGYVCGFGPGYYLWLACAVLVLIRSFLKLTIINPTRAANVRHEKDVDGGPVAALDRTKLS
jgi:hypothetical protein